MTSPPGSPGKTLYVPPAFREERETLVFSLLGRYPFGMVVTMAGSELLISHVPFHFDGENRTVFWHLAMQNPHCAALQAGGKTTLVFNGPHAYISPRWYEKSAVPTWNYIAVHITGAPESLSGPETADLVAMLSHQYEGDAGLGGYGQSHQYAGLLGAIIGFRMKAQDLQSKFKLSQNRSLEDQRAVALQLLASPRTTDAELGRIMLELLGQAPA
jgi:transcriptional regulator